MRQEPTPFGGGHDDVALPVWLDDGLVHRIQLTVEVATGPGVGITAAQILLGALQTLDAEGIFPLITALRIKTSAVRAR